MISQRLLQTLACSTVAFGLSACGMFGSKTSQPVASTAAQEFDPYAHTWKATGRVVTPPPSQPNAALAAQDAAAKQENSTLNKAGRAVASTASAVGRVAKKPLEWLPFGKKDEAPAEDGKPVAQ
jgi:hypothetical protein